MPGEDERKAGQTGREEVHRREAAAPREPQAPRDPQASREPQAPRDPQAPREPQASREPQAPREPRSPLDLVPEILRRGLSAGRDVSESLFPRELASSLAAQLVDARHGLAAAIATEVGRFLRQADIASEMRKVLAGLQVEAKIQLRFSEDESGKLKHEMEVERTNRKSSKPPPPPED